MAVAFKQQTVPYTDNNGAVILDFKLTDRQKYKGNDLAKRAGVVLQYTKAQTLEYEKCFNDPIYFLETYVKIVHIDHGVVPFRLYDYQKDLIRKFKKNRFVAALQCRQSGKSTVVGGFILWFILFRANKEVAILANKGSQAQEILKRVSDMMQYVPFFLKPGMKEYNKTSIEFDNGSKVFSASSSSDSIRGRSLALVYMDEAAFIPNEVEFYESTYPVISSGKKSRIIMTTTPRGARGLFFKLYTDGANGKNSYVTHKVVWSDVPGRDEAWKNETISNTSERQFAQEQNVEFLGSSNTLIDGRFLSTIPVYDPINVLNKDLNVHCDVNERKELYTAYIKNAEGERVQVTRSRNVMDYDAANEVIQRKYVGIADCAEGVGADSSVFTVIDVTNKDKYFIAAIYRSNEVSPMFFPTIIKNMATKYNMAPVLVEINSIGSQVAHILYNDLEYEELLMVSVDKHSGKQRIGGKSPKLGVKTSVSTKAIGCSTLKTLVEGGRLDVYDAVIVDELQNFIIKENGSMEADDGCHDDTVATLFIFAWLTQDEFFKDYVEHDIRIDMLSVNDRMLEESLLPFGFMDDGINEYGDYDDDELPPLGAHVTYRF